MKRVVDFVKGQALGVMLLFMAALLALVMKNSAGAAWYDGFLTIPGIIQIGAFTIHKPLLLWVNDGLMALFFLLIGLDIKREILEGHLSTKAQLSLPVIAALGGIVVPAGIYAFLNWTDPNAMQGWAIPAATDIAFALGILSLFKGRIPTALKTALVAIAVLDDLVAIAIIALFYTESIAIVSLSIGVMATAVLLLLNRMKVMALGPYLVVGMVLWACVLKSGVHATLAGVLIAFCIPLRGKNASGKSPLVLLEQELHPWIMYCILPLFAFANAGVSLAGLSFTQLFQPITIGIAAGLFIGKQLGVMGFTYLGVLTGLCRLPQGVRWQQYYGMALLSGIGFTMSLFIGTLAFDDLSHQTALRLGVLLGSGLSGLLGYAMLSFSSKKS